MGADCFSPETVKDTTARQENLRAPLKNQRTSKKTRKRALT